VSSETDHPLMPVVKAWQEKIRQAAELKSKRFGKDAEEGMLFLAGPYDWLYDGKKGARHFFPPDGADLPTPTFKMTLNKAAELVQIFGPSLYHRNPVRQVNPREFVSLPPDAFAQVAGGDPMAAQALFGQAQVATETGRALDEARAEVLSAYLNYTPGRAGPQDRVPVGDRRGAHQGDGHPLDRGVPPARGGHKMVGSFFDSVDNLVIDPDAQPPGREVGRPPARPPGVGGRAGVRPAAGLAQGQPGEHRPTRPRWPPTPGRRLPPGDRADERPVVYWEVYSKMGPGRAADRGPDWPGRSWRRTATSATCASATGCPTR
jgi:hypothetical protein